MKRNYLSISLEFSSDLNKMVGNIMQLGSSGDKREILRKIKYFFERMRNEKELL